MVPEFGEEISVISKDIQVEKNESLEIKLAILLSNWIDGADSENNPLLEVLLKIKLPNILWFAQVFYDEDMVLDLSLAMEQHRSHFKSLQWTQFRLMSHYHETENITVRISGRNGKGSVLLLDDFVVTLETLDMTKELVKIILEI